MRKLYLNKPVKTFRENTARSTLSVHTPQRTVERVRFPIASVPTGRSLSLRTVQ